jgi:uncharacterized RDD family membrane protein YckC
MGARVAATAVGQRQVPEMAASPAAKDASATAATVVVEIPGLARWAAAAAVDAIVGSTIAFGAIASMLWSRGTRVAWQPVVDFVHADIAAGLVMLTAPPLAALVIAQLVSLFALGGSVGQRIAGLRVVNAANGGRPGPAQLGLRAVASSLGIIALLMGPLWGMWMDRRRRGLGDLVARTLVVRRTSLGRRDRA